MFQERKIFFLDIFIFENFPVPPYLYPQTQRGDQLSSLQPSVRLSDDVDDAT